MAKLRLGLADTHLARPLTRALFRGEHGEDFETLVLPQRRIRPLLEEGALDVGLVTAVAEPLGEGLVAVPDIGVRLRRGGGAARLLWRKREPRSAFLDPSCPGTAEVGRRLLAQRLGRTLDEAAPLDADVEVRTFAGNGAEGAEDLAESWYGFAGEEPVAYLWARRRDVDPREVEFALKSSLRLGLQSLEALAREVAAERGIDPREAARVYRSGVRFVCSAPSAGEGN